MKIGLVGDSGIGKTSLMVRYVEKRFDQDYVETLGVNFMEKTVPTDETEVTMSIWDLGGDRTYLSMLPMVCVDAVAMVFMFDLTQITSLSHIRDWFKQVRGHNAVSGSAAGFARRCRLICDPLPHAGGPAIPRRHQV